MITLDRKPTLSNHIVTLTPVMWFNRDKSRWEDAPRNTTLNYELRFVDSPPPPPFLRSDKRLSLVDKTPRS